MRDSRVLGFKYFILGESSSGEAEHASHAYFNLFFRKNVPFVVHQGSPYLVTKITAKMINWPSLYSCFHEIHIVITFS